MRTVIKQKSPHLFRSISVNNQDDDGVSLLTMEQFEDKMTKRKIIAQLAKNKNGGVIANSDFMIERVEKVSKQCSDDTSLEKNSSKETITCASSPDSNQEPCMKIKAKAIDSESFEETRQAQHIKKIDLEVRKPPEIENLKEICSEDLSTSSETNSIVEDDHKSIGKNNMGENIWRSLWNMIEHGSEISLNEPFYCCGLEIRVMDDDAVTIFTNRLDDEMSAVETLYSENNTLNESIAEVIIEANDAKGKTKVVSKRIRRFDPADDCSESTGVSTYKGDDFSFECSQKDSNVSDDLRYSKYAKGEQQEETSLDLSCKRDQDKIKKMLSSGPGEISTIQVCNSTFNTTEKGASKKSCGDGKSKSEESCCNKDDSSVKEACHVKEGGSSNFTNIVAIQEDPTSSKSSLISSQTPSHKKPTKSQSNTSKQEKRSNDHVQTFSQGMSRFKIKFRVENINQTKQKRKSGKKQHALPQKEQPLGRILDPEVFLKIQSTVKDEMTKDNPMQQKKKSQKKRTKYVQRISKGIK